MGSFNQRLHAGCGCAASAKSAFALAGTERQYERPRPFAYRHLALDLSLDFDRKRVAGSARLDFERVGPAKLGSEAPRELVLDAIAFEISAVQLDTGRGPKKARFVYDGEKLTVTVPTRAKAGSLHIEYSAQPQKGLYFLAPDKAVPDRPTQVWTQCQDEDARHWLPCHDKPHVKLTTELKVKVPHGFEVLSNGALISSRKPKRGRWSFHYQLDKPHPSYLLTLVAGHFDIIEESVELADGRELPLKYYVPPGREADGRRAFGNTPRMLQLFTEKTGVPYPFEQYSQVVVSDFIFGGMENTTATTMYEHILLDEKAALDIESDDLVAHELAHQWFGDHITCRDWSHGWLNEGFATFFENVEREDRKGSDEAEYFQRRDLANYLGEAGSRYQRPIVCRDYVEPIDLFDRHLYEKGGLVLHMLRRELGDELFWSGVQLYLKRHAGGIVETIDLQRALEEVSGTSLERFFDQWVFSPGHPTLRVKAAWESDLLSVEIRQTQKTSGTDTPVFHFLAEVEVGFEDGSVKRFTKQVTGSREMLTVSLPKRPKWVAFDPDFRLAASVTFEAPGDMLRSQLSLGSKPRVRWLAAQALSKKHDPLSVKALLEALANSKETWMVRVEAAHALAKTPTQEVGEGLAAQLSISDARVRRAVVWALGRLKFTEADAALAKLATKDPSYLVEAEAARALGRSKSPKAKKALIKALGRSSWADVVRSAALDGLAGLGDESTLDTVLERTRYGHSSRARRSAMAALVQLSEDRKVRKALEELLDDPAFHVRTEAVRALLSLGQPESRPALRQALDRELDGRVKRRLREALRELGERGDVAERRRVNDELDTLRKRITELETKLAKLEERRKGGNKKGSKK